MTDGKSANAIQQLRKMNSIMWETSWYTLPKEAEAETELACEHIRRAIDIAEDDE